MRNDMPVNRETNTEFVTRLMNFTKIVKPGRGTCGNVYCKITFKDGNLSITGVEGPKHNGDCVGACGQIVMHDWGPLEYAPGWTADMVSEFRKTWEAWHLNDMQAASPAQARCLAVNPSAGPDFYHDACRALEAAGLNPDSSYIHNGKPYKYGSAWLREEVPAEVLAWLQALPDADTTPAWV